tara:strand:+ start:478 stop:1116 length:639 start_codon:yes stop_codon:yes gene_type:complete
MRKELKFIINQGDLELLYLNLLDNGFKVLYPPRNIFSIYYDTDSFLLFNYSEYGYSRRTKVRVRYYNDNVEDAFLEFKHKFDEAGTKTRHLISQYKNQFKISSNKFKSFKIPMNINQDLVPTLGVNYDRYYLLSNNGDIRITIDQNLQFGKIVRKKNNFYLNFYINLPTQILELKSDLSVSNYDKSLNAIFDKFNLIRSRFSKYCTGIKIIY